MDQKRILLIDDEPDIVETIQYCLELRGFRVDAAYDGLEALRLARRNRYDLLVLDIMLPGKNGYEVSRILKQEIEEGKIKAFKVLVLTARRIESGEREDFLNTWSRADLMMYKPFEMDDLIDRIMELLAEEPVQA
jgi:DNA-binding response OmpR family regulator